MKEEEKDRLCRQIVDGIGDAVIVSDREGIIRIWNRGAEGVFGHAEEEAVGQSLNLIIPEKQRTAHWEGYGKAMREGATKYGTATLAVPAVRKDGTRISIEFTIALLKDPDGNLLGPAAVVRNVTARWEREKSLRDRISVLESGPGRAGSRTEPGKSSNGESVREGGTMDLGGKHIAVLAEDLYEDLELWYPLYRFREAGAKVTVVGAGAGEYTSKHGYPVTPDAAADRVSAADFDAVIIPGGYAPDRMRRNKAMVDLVRGVFARGKVVAAICHGGWMLASADVLRGRRATCFFAIRDDIVNAGARYEDHEVVRDGNLVTSRKPEDLPAFCRTILQALSEAAT